MAREVDSLSVQKQLNALFEQRLGSENEILKTMQKELQVAIQLQTVLGKLSTEDLAEKINASSEAMKNLSSQSEEAGDIGSKAMKSIAENTKKSEKSVMSVGGAFKGLSSILNNIGKGALGVAGSMFNIGKSILSIPLGIFKGLMDDAASFVGDTAFATALENVRKEFGSFKEGTSKDILGAYSTMNTQLQAVSGLSVWRVFDGPADQLKYIQEMASKAGSQILQFGGEMAKSAGIIATFDKGMGIGAENMKGMMNRATIFGTTLEKQLGDVANYALQMGKDFGISSKIISREVGNMQKDVRNFGSLTIKQMTVAAIYTKKLGIEIKDLTGLVDKFDNFDKAAESAGLLSQAFGVSVDAFKMMNEQDPAKRLDELRKSMNAAGKSSENMSRQELHLLASTTGLSDEAAKLAFSTKNQGLSYDDVQKKANKAENAQLKQATAMKSLSDNIERVVHAGTQISGFWKNFVAGFERGFKMTSEYRGLMMTLKQAMTQFYYAGMQVGAMFMKLTPGLASAITSMSSIFSADRIKKLLFGFTDQTQIGIKKLGGIVGGFKEIFSGNLEAGFDLIKSSFTNFFTSSRMQPIYDGLLKFGNFLSKGLGEAIGYVAKNAPKYIDMLTAFIKDPKGFIDSLKKAGSGGSGVVGALIKSFSDGFDKNGPVGDVLKKSISNLLTAVWEKLSSDPTIQKAISGYAIFQIGKLFASNIGPIVSTTTTIVSQFSKVSDAAKKASDAASDISKKASDSAGSLSNVGSTMGKVGSNLGKVAAAVGVALAAYEIGKMIGESLVSGMEDEAKATADRQAAIIKNNILDKKTDLGKKNDAKIVFGSGDRERVKKEIDDLKKTIDLETKKAEENMNSRGFFSKLAVSDDQFNIVNLAAKNAAEQQLRILEKSLGNSKINVGKTLKDAGVQEAALAASEDIIQASLPKMIDDFNKLADKMQMKKSDRIEAQAKYLQNQISAQADITKQAAIGIQAEAEKQANKELDMLGLQGEKRAAAYAGILEKSRAEKAKLYAEDHKTDISSAVTSTAGPSVTTSNIESLISQKKTLEENINGLVKFADGGVIKKLNDALPKAAESLSEFNTKLGTSSIATTLNVTQGIVASINSLNNVLGDGNSGAIKIGEKLQKYANNSGLGKNGTYEIKNKGINLKLDLKITMDAGEVERAIVLRKDSIIFDAIEDSASLSMSQEHKNQLAATKNGH